MNPATARAGDLARLIEVLSRSVASPEVEEWAAGPAGSWDRLFQLSREFRVSPVVFTRLRTFREVIPDSAWGKFQKDYSRNALRNLRLRGELYRLVQGFRQAGLPLLVLKGMHLINGIYHDPSQRMVGDIDVLVPRDRLAVATELMHELGYRSAPGTPIEQQTTLSHHLRPFLSPGRTPVEVHWNLLRPNERYRLDPEEYWERCQTVEAGPLQFQALGPNDLLFHVCVHATHHHQLDMGLRSFCDIAEILESLGDRLDLEEFTRFVLRSGLARETCLALYLAKEVTGARVPESILKRLDPDGSAAPYAEVARALLLSESSQLRSVSRNLARFWEAGSLRQRFRVLSSRVFLSRNELAQAYNRPDSSPAIHLFHLVRWFDLFRTWGRSLRRLAGREPGAARVSALRIRLLDWFTQDRAP